MKPPPGLASTTAAAVPVAEGGQSSEGFIVAGSVRPRAAGYWVAGNDAHNIAEGGGGGKNSGT